MKKKKITDQIIEFDESIETARNIRELDIIYEAMLYSDLNNIIFNVLLHALHLKKENLILKN